MTKRTLVLIAWSACAALAACGGDGSSHAAVPGPLDTIEAQAEDIIDIVPASRWDQVRSDVGDVADAWDGYRARALRDGARQELVRRFDDALAQLRTAADAEQAAETMQRANDVSAATVELFGLYDAPFPIDIGRLDVIGRQVVLDVDGGDRAGAKRQVERAQATWDDGLKEDILDHEGDEVADETDTVLAALRRAGDGGDLQALRTNANKLLEVVDSMEALY